MMVAGLEVAGFFVLLKSDLKLTIRAASSCSEVKRSNTTAYPTSLRSLRMVSMFISCYF
jgi:hypothetical protein